MATSSMQVTPLESKRLSIAAESSSEQKTDKKEKAIKDDSEILDSKIMSPDNKIQVSVNIADNVK